MPRINVAYGPFYPPYPPRPYYPYRRPYSGFGAGALFGLLSGAATAAVIGSIADANRRYEKESGSKMIECGQIDKDGIKITECKSLKDGKICFFTWKESGEKDACTISK